VPAELADAVEFGIARRGALQDEMESAKTRLETKTVALSKVKGDRCDLQFDATRRPCRRGASNVSRSDYVTQKIFRNLPIAIAAKSESVITVGDRDHSDDRFRQILASIANQQISLFRGCGVDLPHLLHVSINPPVDEIADRFRYRY
jgi:hypothetical protein